MIRGRAVAPKSFLQARWCHLAMFNYEMDPSLLLPLVPQRTELDAWSGTTYASIVAFRFSHSRLHGFPIPFYQDFEEVNLRFYVRRLAGSEVRRGVVFIREIVARRTVAALARWIYNEPYRALPMRSDVQSAPTYAVRYAWRLKGKWHAVTAGTGRSLAFPAEGSLEQFISEHYWGYTRQIDGSTIEYRVDHPPWTVAPADSYHIDADLGLVYEPALAAALRKPVSVFLAHGSPVTVFRPVAVCDATEGET